MPSYRLLFIAAHFAAVAAAVSAALLLFGVGVLVALHVSIVGKAFQRWSVSASTSSGNGNGNGSGREIGNESSRGLSPKELRALPCYEFRPRSGLVDGECAVCLESFGAGERCRLLPACRHSFHARCVDRWLLTAPVCPICRTRAASAKQCAQGVEH